MPARRLQPSIPHNLETICLKCLEKETGRPYASARALGEGLGRYLSGEPIQARPIKLCECLLRWCRRKPLVAALSTALVLVVIGTFAAMPSLWLLADARGEQAVAERNKSTRQRDRALHLLNEMTKLAESSLSVEPRMQRVQCDMLENVLKEYEDLAQDPENVSDRELRHKWAQAYYRVAKLQNQLGDNPKALHCYLRAIPIWEVLRSECPDESRFLLALFHCQNNISDIYAATDVEKANTARSAARMAAEELVQRFPSDPVFHDLLASQHNRAARTAAGKLDYSHAHAEIHRAIEVSPKLCEGNPDRPFFRNQLGYCLLTKGNILESSGDLAGAEEAYAQALRIKQELCGLDIAELSTTDERLAPPIEAAVIQLALARIQLNAGRATRAEENLKQSLRTMNELAASYPVLYYLRGQRPQVLRQLAELYLATGRTEEAKQAFMQCVEMIRQNVSDFPAERRHTAIYLIEAFAMLPGT